jgi:hypothetical protein
MKRLNLFDCVMGQDTFPERWGGVMWEYKKLTLRGEKAIALLNKAGADGWEVCASDHHYSVNRGRSHGDWLFILRRPILERDYADNAYLPEERATDSLYDCMSMPE